MTRREAPQPLQKNTAGPNLTANRDSRLTPNDDRQHSIINRIPQNTTLKRSDIGNLAANKDIIYAQPRLDNPQNPVQAPEEPPKKHRKFNITQTYPFRICLIMLALLCSLGLIKIRADGHTFFETDRSKFYKKIDKSPIEIEREEENKEYFINDDGDKVYYSLQILSNNSISYSIADTNLVSSNIIRDELGEDNPIHLGSISINGIIKYNCSERINTDYNRYNVVVSDNNICTLQKNYHTISGNMVDNVEVKLHDRNIESIHYYIEEESGEKILNFTKQVYDWSSKTTTSANAVPQGENTENPEAAGNE